MIINGGSRSGGRFFARHLMRADENERVKVVEIRGLAAQSVPDALQEMEAVASGSRCRNYFYHANINTRENEHLTMEQWEKATDTLERELGLSGQPRFVVEHEKEGRTHRHVVWSRIDADSMKAISDSLTYRKHELAAREIEREFGLEPVESVLTKDREGERPERNPQDWETFRGQESGIDPKQVKAEVTALWNASDSGTAFKAALEEAGYILARGDRRDFCIVDQAGDEHSLARRISGAKAAEIRARMADVDRESLPSVNDARELAQQLHHDAPDQIQSAEAQPLGLVDSFAADMSRALEQEAVAARQAEAERAEIITDELANNSAFDRFVAATEIAMQAGNDDLDMQDGLTWWERAALLLHDASERVTTWVRERWQGVVEKWSPDRDDSEPHPEATSGPDMGR